MTGVDLLAECVAGVVAFALGVVRALTASPAALLAPVAAWLAFLLVVLARARVGARAAGVVPAQRRQGRCRLGVPGRRRRSPFSGAT